MVFAIEPMVNVADRMCVGSKTMDRGDHDGNESAHFEHTVAVLEWPWVPDGPGNEGPSLVTGARGHMGKRPEADKRKARVQPEGGRHRSDGDGQRAAAQCDVCVELENKHQFSRNFRERCKNLSASSRDKGRRGAFALRSDARPIVYRYK